MNIDAFIVILGPEVLSFTSNVKSSMSILVNFLLTRIRIVLQRGGGG